MASSVSFAVPKALYVHVPLCKSRCAYCDFHSLPADAWSPEALEALVDATLGRVDELLGLYSPDSSPLTVYVGGGTPTALPRALLKRLLAGLSDRIGTPLEWTMEANPESLGAEVLDIAQAAGVNRISLGVQCLDDDLLSRLGRIATSGTAMKAVERAAARQGLRVSADLISGLPRRGSLASEARVLLDAGVEHLSIYDLTLEEGTRLHTEVEAGSFILPDPDAAFEERLEAERVLSEAGFRRYEISNFAPPGRESLHNLVYWRMDSYLGAGPGAVSTLAAASASGGIPGQAGASLRIEEGRMIPGKGASPAVETAIRPKDSAFEAILMAYRTVFGLDEEAFAARFGLSSEALIGGSRAAWRERLVPAAPWPSALVERPGTTARSPRLALDSRGLDLLNRFLVDCLTELEEKFPESPPLPGSESAGGGRPRIPEGYGGSILPVS